MERGKGRGLGLGLLGLLVTLALLATSAGGARAAGTQTAPTVSGSPLIGATLTATPVVSGDQIDWETCTAAADGSYTASGTSLATGDTFVTSLADQGSTLCAVETETGLLGITTTVTSSNAVGPIAGLAAPPTLSAGTGAVAQGQTITLSQGSWGAGARIGDFWLACDGGNCTAVQSGQLSYVVTRADAGDTLEVFEGAYDGAQKGTAYTAATGPVVASVPVEQTAPTISGSDVVGDTLTASSGTWSNDPTGYSYQWERCASASCTAITGARSATYTLANADAGDSIEVLVSASVLSSTSQPYPSYPTGTVSQPSSGSSGTTSGSAGSGGSTGSGSSGSGSSGSGSSGSGSGSSGSGSSGSGSGSSGSGSGSGAPPSAHAKLVRLQSLLQWTFRYAPAYTQILQLEASEVPVGSHITIHCTGHGCPYKTHRSTVRAARGCHGHGRDRCSAPRRIDLQIPFRRRDLRTGAYVTVMLSRTHEIGKYYRFTVRARREPAVRISCLAPGSSRPGHGCSGA